MKPIIGVISRPEVSSGGNKIMCIYEDIRKAIIKSGGIPLGIMPVIEDINGIDANIYRLLDMCDGVIFQGGDDFYKYDLDCLKYVYEKNIPALGICLGMQMIGSFFGGEVIELNNNHHKQKNKKYVHNIYVNPNSKLYSIFQEKTIKVNSRHKFNLVNPEIDICAVSEDNVIEAIENKKNKFLIGVQWHPESMIEYDKVESRLFDYFIETCRGD